jgi:hypothetical protein
MNEQTLRVFLNERVSLEFRGGRTVRVTHNMFHALSLLRPALIDVARHRDTITYGEGSLAAQGAYLPRGMGPMLDVLTVDCQRRGEPSLASLVVTKSGGEVGSAYGSGAAAERGRCYDHWARR